MADLTPVIDKNPKDGFIYYDNLGLYGNNLVYWSQIRKGALSYFNKVRVQQSGQAAVVNFLKKMADNEQKKEIKLLTNIFGATVNEQQISNNPTNFLTMINSYFNIEGQWKRTIKKIQNAAADPSQTTSLGSRGTLISKTYGTYLLSQIKNNILSFLLKHSYTEIVNNTKKFQNDLDIFLNSCMDNALDNMLNAKNSNFLYDNNYPWQELLETLNETENFRKNFKTRLFSKYGFDNIKTNILAELKKNLTGSKENIKKTINTVINDNFKSVLESSKIGGYVEEELVPIIMKATSKKNDVYNVSFSTKAAHASTDIIHVLNKEVPLVEGQLQAQFNFTSRNKTSVAQSMEKFQKEILNKNSQNYIVYETTKNYNLGEKFFDGFRGTSFNTQSLKELLYRINYKHADALVNKMLNTIPGAIYQNDKSFVEKFNNSIASKFAYLLFDDFTTIGDFQPDSNVIHIFRLSGIVLPLSYLLKKMALAAEKSLKNLDNFIKVENTLPDKVLYDYPQEDITREASNYRWINQRNVATKNNVFYIQILKNFKELILSDFNV